jgi:hypothetical protein
MVSKALPFVLALLSSAAFAQDPVPPSICDSTTNLTTDGNNNYCFNFEVEAGDPLSSYDPYQGSYDQYFLQQVDFTQHDPTNPLLWPGLSMEYWGVLTIKFPTGTFANPEDPLLIRDVLELCGGPCDEGHGGPGYINRAYDGSSWSVNDAYSNPDSSCIPYRGVGKNYTTLTRTVTFTGWQDVSYNGDYSYVWSGSVPITFTGTPKHHCGYGGCSCTEVYKSNKSWGTAIAGPHP